MQTTTSPQRRPRDWEVLKALESLSPPSPSPSLGSDFLTTLASSGEIPIFLDLGEDDDFDNSRSLASTNIPGNKVQIPPNLSLDTIGTFGPRGKFPDYDRSRVSRASYLSQDSLSSSSLSLQCPSPIEPRDGRLLTPRRTHEGGYYDHRTSSASQFTISAYLSPLTRPIPVTPSRGYSPNLSPWTTPSPSCDTLNLPGTSQHNYSIGSSLSTIVFAAGSGTASPTLSSTIATEAQSYAHQYRQHSRPASPIYIGAIDIPPSSPKTPDYTRSRFATVRPHTSRPNSPLLGSPTFSRGAVLSRKKSTNTIRSTDSGNSAQSAHSSRSIGTKSLQPIRIGPVSYTFTEPPIKVPGLPSILSWLENIQLELWIDQEGFRLIRPVFTLYGYTPGPSADRDLDLVNALTYGFAEFRPAQSQSYVFHRGALLDPPPALRKITVMGDDKRDYISRQAALTIKDNGIYSVSGTESFDCGPPSPHGHIHSTGSHEPPKLKWRFDYMVDDHRPADGASKVHAGERTLTPLVFSCSPGLVHPTHGKKIRIMHVVRKNLIPKLTSERLDDTSGTTATATQSAPTPAVRIRVQTDPPPHHHERRGRPEEKAHGGPDSNPARSHGKHRRAHSSALQVAAADENQECVGLEGNRIGVKKNRAASIAVASKVGVAAVERVLPEQFLVPTQRPRSLRVSDPLLARHIMPPTELTELLNEAPAWASDPISSLRPPPRKARG